MKSPIQRTPNKLTHKKGEGNQSEWSTPNIDADTLIEEVMKVMFNRSPISGLGGQYNENL